MKKITYVFYDSDDGARFTTEEECREYELTTQRVHDIKKLDSVFEPTTDWRDTSYYYMPTYKNLSAISRFIYRNFGCDIPEESGYFYWDDDEDEWNNLEKKIDDLEEELSYYRDILNKLEKSVDK